MGLLAALGGGAFFYLLSGSHPERAWQAYLINFLIFSSIAQGCVLFSAVMHVTKARWSQSLTGLAESFSAFFPVSFVLFLILFLGEAHIFPWKGIDLGEKEAWLNVRGVLIRGSMGLGILYFLGFSYLYFSLSLKFLRNPHPVGLRKFLDRRWMKDRMDTEACRKRTGISAVLYILGYAVVLSLIAYDLVMALDPHWYSTLFGAYHFIKAFYLALGALVIFASVLHINPNLPFAVNPSQFHDLGKLFFAFCLLWADFFYCQFVVIWYGNIPEESSYVIERTMMDPWQPLAWFIFIVSFALPFLILLNRRIKKNPKWMSLICAMVILGLWLEHLLLVGPAISRHARALPLGFSDGLVFLGFLGVMGISISTYIRIFPEIVMNPGRGR
ncbi:MAG: hypothetical protein AB1659_00510 [Thermodesulfobacteriota bacterium]